MYTNDKNKNKNNNKDSIDTHLFYTHNSTALLNSPISIQIAQNLAS